MAGRDPQQRARGRVQLAVRQHEHGVAALDQVQLELIVAVLLVGSETLALLREVFEQEQAIERARQFPAREGLPASHHIK